MENVNVGKLLVRFLVLHIQPSLNCLNYTCGIPLDFRKRLLNLSSDCAACLERQQRHHCFNRSSYKVSLL